VEFENVYDKYFNEIFNFILKRISNVELAEDLVGVVFMKVFEKRESYDPSKASIRTWIYTIANNELIDYYRRRRVNKSFEKVKPYLKTKDVLEEIQEKTDEINKKKLYNEILEVLDDKLSREEKDIVISHYIEEKPYKEIAEIKNMNCNTLRSKAHRDLKKVEEFINLEERGLI